MVGPSGFVQRIKGRVQTDHVTMGQGGVQEYVYPIIDVSVTPNSTLPGNGVSVLKSSGAANFAILGAPQPGMEKTIVVTTMSSSAIVVKTNSTGVTFFDGVNTYWKVSTTAGVAGTMVLVGLSTSQWANLGIWPSTVGTAGMGNTT
jgi:hypothetical protein